MAVIAPPAPPAAARRRTRGPRPGEPYLTRRPRQRMAVAVTRGDPIVVLPKVMPALYGAVYRHKFALKKLGKPTFKVGPLTGRWPDAHRVPREKWTAYWGLAVPSGTRTLPQLNPEVPIRLETWDYGRMVAEVLHIGPYSEEGPVIQALHAFIKASGYEMAGVHEEEYLSAPGARVQKTLIRYPVRKRG
jgi:hypothetical protein